MNARDIDVELVGPDEIDDGLAEWRAGRSAPTDLHLLPPGAAARRAGRTDIADPGRSDYRRRSRARFSCPSRPWHSAWFEPSARSETPASRIASRPRTSCHSARTAVLGVLYLLFNEGYSATSGAHLVRDGLAAEALRLARLLSTLMQQDCEVSGLLALMLLHDARRDSRLGELGNLVLLEDQDRTLWNTDQIAEAVVILRNAMERSHPGPYQIQAAIVACHATASDAADTDWRQIAALYEHLAYLAPSAVVELNRAVAIAMADGPEAGLNIVESLAESEALAGYHLLPAVRADLLRRLLRFDEAATYYRDALGQTRNEGERQFLERRLREMTDARGVRDVPTTPRGSTRAASAPGP